MSEPRKPARAGSPEERAYRKTRIDEDEVMVIDEDPLVDYETFADPGDETPGERRRDPLRR